MSSLLLADGVSRLLLGDGVSRLLLGADPPPATTVARASFNCYVGWSAYNIGLLTFDSSRFDGTDVFAVSPIDSTFSGPYDDLSAIFDGYTVTRGRTTNLDQIAAGTCNIDVRDPNGLFNPENPGSPLYGQLEDRLHPVKLTATRDGATTTRFYGWVSRFHWEPQGRRGVTRLECVDLFYWLARTKPTIAPTGVTTTGTAIGLILDAVGATDPAARNLDTGDSIPDFTADGTTTGLELIQGLLEAERGMFFVAGSGIATYRARSARILTTSAFTFVDRMQTPSPGVDWDQVYDRVTVTRNQTGHTAVATDTATIAKSAINDLDIQTDYLTTDSQADALAEWVLLQNKDPKPPMRSFAIDSRDADLLEQQLARELVDRITVQAARGGTDNDFNIEQITETLDPANGRLTSQYLLSRVSPIKTAQFDLATFDADYQFVY